MIFNHAVHFIHGVNRFAVFHIVCIARTMYINTHTKKNDEFPEMNRKKKKTTEKDERIVHGAAVEIIDERNSTRQSKEKPISINTVQLSRQKHSVRSIHNS